MLCSSINHLTENCLVGSLFVQNSSYQVNYINNFNPRPTNDRYSNTYNPSQRNHPKFSYRPHPPTTPSMNARLPPISKIPLSPTSSSKVQPKCHDREYVFGLNKPDEYIKQLASNVDVLITHNKILEAQIAKQASSSSTPLGRLPSRPESKPLSIVIMLP